MQVGALKDILTYYIVKKDYINVLKIIKISVFSVKVVNNISLLIIKKRHHKVSLIALPYF